MRRFHELDEREILALAIANEEEDGRVYADYAEYLRENYPDSARLFDDMAAEEEEHRRALIDLYVGRFGRHIAYITRRDVRGAQSPAAPRATILKGIDAVRAEAKRMETNASRFYREAADRSTDAPIRKLLGDLASAELDHLRIAGTIEQRRLPGQRRDREDDAARRRFVLQIVQPGLVGLMDGSVSTLAPVFAAAFATHHPWDAFLVGLAASIGAGISMGFAEALADDGKLSGRGTPILRGAVCGMMTTAGGIGHTLPFLIADFWTAIGVAAFVVAIELGLIAWIQYRYMEAPPLSAVAKVMLGGALVLAAGIAIGSG
ncbi:iron exporter MbfA [Sphingomonas bacterium]|uniref:iron exporter MbfA n=1 Tax=Sphingomonas bacterium TaxID=1895847 RepID=UPI0015759131|nr:ferritin family protein [Sphingomonas bacterium]